jgi:hypothetical protein
MVDQDPGSDNSPSGNNLSPRDRLMSQVNKGKAGLEATAQRVIDRTPLRRLRNASPTLSPIAPTETQPLVQNDSRIGGLPTEYHHHMTDILNEQLPTPEESAEIQRIAEAGYRAIPAILERRIEARIDQVRHNLQNIAADLRADHRDEEASAHEAMLNNLPARPEDVPLPDGGSTFLTRQDLGALWLAARERSEPWTNESVNVYAEVPRNGRVSLSLSQTRVPQLPDDEDTPEAQASRQRWDAFDLRKERMHNATSGRTERDIEITIYDGVRVAPPPATYPGDISNPYFIGRRPGQSEFESIGFYTDLSQTPGYDEVHTIIYSWDRTGLRGNMSQLPV